VSLVFKGPTYVWPNPLRQSKGDLAHFSFDLNVPGGSSVTVTLNIYDFAGDLVYQKVNPNVQPRRDNDQLVTWNLQNQSGAKVARGIYIFRLEAEDQTTQNRTNAVGKILVVE
jgi:flagellar hook assembly protein FlgD